MVMLLAGCGADEKLNATEEKVMGEYACRLPAGQIERWRLEPGGRFTQEFYDSFVKYEAGTPAHRYSSTWYIKDQELWIKETTEYFDQHPPFRLLKEPDTASWASSLIWRSSAYGIKVPVIIVLPDEGVIYKRITPDDPLIRTVGWE